MQKDREIIREDIGEKTNIKPNSPIRGVKYYSEPNKIQPRIRLRYEGGETEDLTLAKETQDKPRLENEINPSKAQQD